MKGYNTIYELFLDAKHFDEGEMYQGKEYTEVANKLLDLYEKLGDRLGVEGTDLLEAYTAALYEESDLENLHFFEEGYRVGRAGRKIKDPTSGNC